MRKSEKKAFLTYFSETVNSYIKVLAMVKAGTLKNSITTQETLNAWRERITAIKDIAGAISIDLREDCKEIYDNLYLDAKQNGRI